MTLDAPLPWSDVKRLYLPLLTERAPDEADVPKGVWKGRSDGVYCSADAAIGAIACVGGTAKAGRQCPSRAAVRRPSTRKSVCAPPPTVDAGNGGADAGVEEGAPRADATCALGAGQTSGNALAAGFLALALALAGARRSGRPGGRSSIAPRQDDLD